MIAVFKIILATLFLVAANKARGQADPEYIIRVGNITGFNVKRDSFIIQREVTGLKKIELDKWQAISIDSFKVRIIRSGKTIFKCNNEGKDFNSALLKFLAFIRPKDQVEIFEPYGHYLTKTRIELAPLRYEIE